jgi:hypothetical protein
VAKSVARQLATAALWVRIQTSLKIINGRHKRRSGRQTLARQKNIPKKNRESVSALTAGEYTTTLLVMVDIVKGGGLVFPLPPPSPDRADFSIMIEYTPQRGHCHSMCTLWALLYNHDLSYKYFIFPQFSVGLRSS